ncbi:hypothetical protein BDA99DRAFT_543213 [Phascolomyces articulosus]|uniref:Yeast cell wall synthesis Kre9/Knh1-like N-terminal domain-containing protein n=1 Tax=Phascolomyces articulosus TaxID=60185 RepID=A0AAD5JYH8_9FUNG|nr:hypothetical protein BDA99DRAFT_543213 [Phascolomyces articulosus]
MPCILSNLFEPSHIKTIDLSRETQNYLYKIVSIFVRTIMMITALIFLLSILNTLTFGIVWNAKITVPNETTVWEAGKNYTVKWETTTEAGPIPDNVTGIIKLGYLEEGSIDEHLYWDLASGFLLNSGSNTIRLPCDLETKDSYIIVLMGNSGNASPKFTIHGSAHGRQQQEQPPSQPLEAE